MPDSQANLFPDGPPRTTDQPRKKRKRVRKLTHGELRQTRDLFDAVCEACDIKPCQVGELQRGRINKAVVDIFRKKGTPEQIQLVADKMREAWGRTKVTATSIAANWEMFLNPGKKSAQPGVSQKEEYERNREEQMHMVRLIDERMNKWLPSAPPSVHELTRDAQRYVYLRVYGGRLPKTWKYLAAQLFHKVRRDTGGMKSGFIKQAVEDMEGDA